MKDQAAFAHALSKARKTRGLTQTEVADHLGISGSLVSQWENLHAEPDDLEVFRLEGILDTGPGQLSGLLGYLPLDEPIRLGYSLVALFDEGPGPDILKQLAAIHRLLEPDGEIIGARIDFPWWSIPELHFGRMLKISREYQSLTQHQLGRKLGVSQGLISQWERSDRYRPTPDQVFAIERALERDPGSLSRHLGYVPVDDRYNLAIDLVRLFGRGEGPQLLKRLAALHDPGPGLELAG
jgi:transcriptional regulator with XRE-family HTH domain